MSVIAGTYTGALTNETFSLDGFDYGGTRRVEFTQSINYTAGDYVWVWKLSGNTTTFTSNGVAQTLTQSGGGIDTASVVSIYDQIFRLFSGSTYWPHYVCRLAIYNRALSSSEETIITNWARERYL